MAFRAYRSPSWLIVVALSVVLIACTSQDQLQSAPGDRPQAAPQSKAELELEEIDVEPSARFVRIDAGSFANRSRQISIQDAIETADGSGWMFAGFLEDGRSRSRSAVISTATTDDSANSIATLPSEGLSAAATSLRRESGQHLVSGYIVDQGQTKPVVWSFDSNPAEATVSNLPTTSPNARALRFGSGDTDPVLIGTETTDGQTRPAVWQLSSDGWTAITIVEPETLTDTETLTMSAATVWRDQLIVVGVSSEPTRDPIPMLWAEKNGQLQIVTTSGLPESGTLNDVAIRPGDDLVVVGTYTSDAISKPLVSAAADVEGPWKSSSPQLDTYGASVSSGFGLQRILVREDELIATATEPFIQQLYRSKDNGQTWSTDQDLAELLGRNLQSNGFAIDQANNVIVAGGDVAIQWDGSSFDRIEDANVLEIQTGLMSAVDIHVTDNLWYIVGSEVERTSSGYDYDSSIWQSPDGIRWGTVAIDRPEESIGVAFIEDEGGQVTAVRGGSKFYLDPIFLSSDDGSGTWSSQTLDIPAPALRLLPQDAANGPGDSILVSGSKLVYADGESTDTRSKPLFLIVESDGSSREALLTSSPVDPDLNGIVNCMSGKPGDYLAVLSWGTRQVEVATSAGGERWSSSSSNNDFDGLEISDCLASGDNRVIVGQDGMNRPVVATSSDNEAWEISTLDGIGAVTGVSEVLGELFLVGWTQSDIGSDGTLWRRDTDGSWNQMTEIGLEGDEFSKDVAIYDMVENDGVVVAIGQDQGRAGVWMASSEVLSR